VKAVEGEVVVEATVVAEAVAAENIMVVEGEAVVIEEDGVVVMVEVATVQILVTTVARLATFQEIVPKLPPKVVEVVVVATVVMVAKIIVHAILVESQVTYHVTAQVSQAVVVVDEEVEHEGQSNATDARKLATSLVSVQKKAPTLMVTMGNECRSLWCSLP
jgi:hypothetical protein